MDTAEFSGCSTLPASLMCNVNSTDPSYFEVSIGEGEIESSYACDLVFDREALAVKQEAKKPIDDEDIEDSNTLLIPVSNSYIAECRPGAVHQKSGYQFYFKGTLSVSIVDPQSNVQWLAEAFKYAMVIWLIKPFSQWLGESTLARREGYRQYEPKKWSNREVHGKPESIPDTKNLLKGILPNQRMFFPDLPGLSGASLQGGDFLVQEELYQPSAPVVENLPAELAVIDFTHNTQIQAVLIEVLYLLSVIGDSAMTEVGLDLSDFESMTLGELMHYRNLLREYLERLEQNGLLEEVANTPSAVVFREFVLMILADLDEFQRIQSLRYDNPNPPVTSRPQSLAGEVLSRLRYLRLTISSKKLKLAIMQAYITELEKYRPAIEKEIEQEVAELIEGERFQRMTREERKRYIEEKKQEVLKRLAELEQSSSYWERTMKQILSNRLDILTADLADINEEPGDMDGKDSVTPSPPASNDKDEAEEDREEEQPDPHNSGNSEHSSGGGNQNPDGNGASEQPLASSHTGFLIQDPYYTAFLADLFATYYQIEESDQDDFINNLMAIFSVVTEEYQQKTVDLQKRLIKLLKTENAYSHLQIEWDTMRLDKLIKLILDYGRYAYLTQEVMKLFTEDDAQLMLTVENELNMGRQSTQRRVSDPQNSEDLRISFSHGENEYTEQSLFMQLLRDRLERLELHRRMLSLTQSDRLSFSENEIRRWREQCARDGQRLPIIFRYLVEGEETESYLLGDTASLIRHFKSRFPKADITALEAEKNKASGERKLQLEKKIAELRSESAENAGIETSSRMATVCELPEILDPQLPGLEVLLYMVLNQDSPNTLRGAVFGTDRLLGRDNLLGFLVTNGGMISPSNLDDTLDSATPVVVELTSTGRLKLKFHKEFDTWTVPDSKQQMEGMFTVSMEYEFQITGQKLILEYSGFSYRGNICDAALKEGHKEVERRQKERSADFKKRMKGRVDNNRGRLQKIFNEELGDATVSVEWSRERAQVVGGLLSDINTQMVEIEQANLRSWLKFEEYYKRLKTMMTNVEREYQRLLKAEAEYYRKQVNSFTPSSSAARKYAEIHSHAKHYRDRLKELENKLVRMKTVSRQSGTDLELERERVRYLQASEELETILYDIDFRGALYKAARALPETERENLHHLFDSVKLMVSHATLTVTEKLNQITQETTSRLNTPSEPSALNREGSQSQEDLLDSSHRRVSEGQGEHSLRKNPKYVPREFRRDSTMRAYPISRVYCRLTDYPISSVSSPDQDSSSLDFHQSSLPEQRLAARESHTHTLSEPESTRYRMGHRRSDSQPEVQLHRVPSIQVLFQIWNQRMSSYLSAYSQDQRFIGLISHYVQTDFYEDLRDFEDDLKLFSLTLSSTESSALELIALEQQVASLLARFIDAMGIESLANALIRIFGEQILIDLQRIFPTAIDV